MCWILEEVINRASSTHCLCQALLWEQNIEKLQYSSLSTRYGKLTPDLFDLSWFGEKLIPYLLLLTPTYLQLPLIIGCSIERRAQMWCIHHTRRGRTLNDEVRTGYIIDSVKMCWALSISWKRHMLVHVITLNLVINSDQVSTPDMASTGMNEPVSSTTLPYFCQGSE